MSDIGFSKFFLEFQLETQTAPFAFHHFDCTLCGSCFHYYVCAGKTADSPFFPGLLKEQAKALRIHNVTDHTSTNFYLKQISELLSDCLSQQQFQTTDIACVVSKAYHCNHCDVQFTSIL